jgi:uncharacterized protein RhaS with RHS repeats
VDPLAEKYDAWSTYQYVRNNPILRIDPNGLSDQGYSVDDYGRVKIEDETGGKDFDVLYTKENYDAGKREYNEIGSGEKGIKIKPGILDKKLTQVSESNSLNDKTVQTTYQFTGDEQGESLFRFLAKNTNVEWNLIQYGDNHGDNGKNLLVTTHDPGAIETSAQILDYVNLILKEKIKYDVHNHPSGSHAASPGDGSCWLKIWNLNNPNAKCGIYTSQDNAFTQYYPKKKK